MNEERDLFERYLRTKDLKMTSPRETVLQAFLATEGHLSAEDVFDAARRIDPGIGQATVFRTLKLLEGPRRYEHAYRHRHHDHLLCIRCGKLVEFFDPAIEKAQDRVFEKYGFKAIGHMMELKGLCAECTEAVRDSLAK
ncbi:transcriptional repressor [bacterium]|nr:transcriptional repressor [bacterium]